MRYGMFAFTVLGLALIIVAASGARDVTNAAQHLVTRAPVMRTARAARCSAAQRVPEHPSHRFHHQGEPDVRQLFRHVPRSERRDDGVCDASGLVHPLTRAARPRLSGTSTGHSGHRAQAIDGGKMDRFVNTANALQHGIDMADAQLYRSDIPNYWAYARRFTLSDNFFATVKGESFPNHLFTIGANAASIITNPRVRHGAAMRRTRRGYRRSTGMA